MKLDPEWLEKAADVQRGIWAHEEQYAADCWYDFQMRNNLSDEELEAYKTHNRA